MRGNSGRYLALALVLVTVTYGIYQARTLIHGPVLTVREPHAGAMLESTLMEVHGHADNVTRVTINGRPIALDTSGTFKEKLVTPNGYGVLLVEAYNRFGHRTQERIEFVGRPQTTYTALQS